MYGQCDPVYKRELAAPELYPGLDIYHILQEYQDSAGIHLLVDQANYTEPIRFTDTLGTSQTVLHTTYTDHPQARSFIETPIFADSISGNMGEGALMSSVVTQRGCVTYYITKSRKHNSKLYTYFSDINEVRIRDIPRSAVIGNNDTSMFLRTVRFKEGKQTYEEGTIISIGVFHSQVEEPRLKKQPDRFSDCMFYADPYVIRQQFGEEFEFNCSPARLFTLHIYHNGALTDSITYWRYWGNELFSLKNDTLTASIIVQDTVKGNASLAIYQFANGNKIRQWKETDWPEIITPGTPPIGRYFISGKRLYIQTNRYVDPEKLPLNSAGKPVSLNGLVAAEKGIVPVIMAFDLDSNTFLGYPRVAVNN